MSFDLPCYAATALPLMLALSELIRHADARQMELLGEAARHKLVLAYVAQRRLLFESDAYAFLAGFGIGRRRCLTYITV
jgi:hypothetical protein